MTRYLRAIPALAVACALSAVAVPATATATTASVAVIPQWGPAQAAAQYLAGQLTPEGYIPISGKPSQPNLSDTAQSILALSAANVDRNGAQQALTYMTQNVNAYVTVDGADGPGQLAILVLDAVALRVDPHNFGGTDLVARLLATQQTNGADAGVFGTETQLDDYLVGTYQQGLALSALASVGITSGGAVAAAVSWLVAQQCPDGGWPLPDIAQQPCSGLPADFAGPDTNSTSFAVQGLAAVNALTPTVAAGAQSFLVGGQDADAGWSYYPNTSATPGVTDPDSTALVIQGLLALGLSPSTLTKGSADPFSAMLTYQLHSGVGSGGFYFPPAPAPASNLATYQAIPALLAFTLPFGPSDGSYWLAGSDGGVFAFGHAGYFGSLPGLGIHTTDVMGLAPSPDGRGYLMGTADGGAFAFGDARFEGSLPGLGIVHDDVVGLVPTADGPGYLMVTAGGAVFAFGDARYAGSLPGLGITTSSVVGLTLTRDGHGYWVVASNGAVFAFGDARYRGSIPGLGLTTDDVVGLLPTADGFGYWLTTTDGGVFSFGDAAFLGSAPSVGVTADNVASSTLSSRGAGYLMATGTGGVLAFGDAVFGGSIAGSGVNDIISVVAPPAGRA